MAVISKALNYKIVADTGDFQRDLKAAQKELKAAERAMMDTLTPAQKLESRLATLDKAYKEGKVGAEDYRKANERLRESFARTQEIEKATKALEAHKRTAGQGVADVLGKVPIADKFAGGVGKGVDFIGGNLGTVAAAAVVGGLVAKTVNDIWNGAEEQVQVLKEQKKTAGKLGIGQRDYMGLAGVGQKVGVDSESLGLGLNKLSGNIGEAKLGDESAQKKFKALGISWKELQGIPLDKQFQVVNAAIQKHSDVNERAALAQSVYGKGAKDMGALLRLTASDIEAAKAAMEKSGQLLSQADIDRMNAANASIKGYKAQQEGLYRSLAPARAEYDAFFEKIKSGWLALFKLGTDSYDGIGNAMSNGVTEKQNKAKRDSAKADHEAAVAYAKSIGDTAFVSKSQAAGASGEDSEVAKAKTKLQDKIDALNEEAKATHLSSQEAALWLEGVKAGNSELAKQAIALQKYVETRRKVSAEVVKLDEEADMIGVDKRYAGSTKLGLQGATGDEVTYMRGKEKRNWERQGEFDASETLRKAQISAQAMGLASEAATIFELRQKGATKATLEMLIAAKNVGEMAKLTHEVRTKEADAYFKSAEVSKQAQLQASGGGKVGGMSAKDRAKEETDELRRQYDLQVMAYNLRREGTGDADIKKQLDAKRRQFAAERQMREDTRREALLSEAQTAKESLHPEIQYQTDLKRFREMLDGKMISEKDHFRLRQQLVAKYADAMKQPTGVEAMRADSQDFRLQQAERADEAWRVQQAEKTAQQLEKGPQEQFAPPPGWYEAMLDAARAGGRSTVVAGRI